MRFSTLAGYGGCFLPAGMHRLLRLALVILSVAPLAGTRASADDVDGAAAVEAPRVTVVLASGRSFTGAVDTATNDQVLWLRADLPRGALLRPIDWDRVKSATHNGVELTADELRAQAPELQSEHPLVGVLRQRPGAEKVSGTFSGRVIGQEKVPDTFSPTAAVCALAIEASIGNWDADAEQDGLVVRVQPRDEEDQIVPADGTLEVRLIGVSGERRASPTNLARARDNQRPIIGHWTVALSADQFGPHGAVVRLPFQAVDPQLDPHVRSLGTVQADFTVPGQDVFQARAELVRLRPFAIRTE
ncbi:MAG: hypothetical protein WD176_07240 [Pirellulales bacterium]